MSRLFLWDGGDVGGAGGGVFFVFLRWGGVEHQEPSGCFFTRK